MRFRPMPVGRLEEAVVEEAEAEEEEEEEEDVVAGGCIFEVECL
jgi:hypothetical protein